MMPLDRMPSISVGVIVPTGAAYDAAQVILALAIVVGVLNWTRDPLAAALFRSYLRRRWALACQHANLATQ